jgi:MYXO-CTERM domain-containing protein
VVGRLISAANFIIDGVLSDQRTSGTFHGEGRLVGGTTVATPEPLTVGFVAVGVLAAGWLRRRR